MPNLKITPPSALVTAGHAVTFHATDDDNHAVNVIWSLTPQLGSLVTAAPAPSGQPPAQANPPQGQGSPSATYVAPTAVQNAQTVAVTAASSTDTASVTLSLTPDAISILPAEVDLHAGQKQQFVAIVASGSGDAELITWILTPQVGVLDEAGLYTAPDLIPDDGTLTVTAASKHLGKQVSAKVTLTPEPWRGLGTVLLAGYLLLVFCVVYLLIGLWPSEIPNIDVLKADQAQAQANLDKSKLALQTALAAGGGPKTPNQTNGGGAGDKTGGAGNKESGTSTDTTTDSMREKASDALLQQLAADLEKARRELGETTRKLTNATLPTVDTRMIPRFNREIDLLCLVLLAGGLGSFLHMAQSYSDFTGNRTLKKSWLWWYCFLPFVGAGLALVLYAGLRGGLITATTTPAVKTSDLNPYGLLAAAALAGMFSKAATTKLGEVFDTVFQTSKGKQTKDPVTPDSQSAGQPSAKLGAVGGTTTNTTK